MNIFNLFYDAECKCGNKIGYIRENVEKESIKDCTLVLHNGNNVLQYAQLKKLLESVESDFVNINIDWKFIFKNMHIEQYVVELLKEYKISVTFVFDEYNFFNIGSSEFSCKKKEYVKTMESIEIIEKNDIDFDILLIVGEEFLNAEEKVAEWIRENNFDVTLIPKNKDVNISNIDNGYSNFVITTYKMLQKKQYLKVLNPISHYLAREVGRRSNNYFKNNRNEDNLYFFNDDDMSPFLGIYSVDNDYTDEIFVRYKTLNNFNYFLVSGFKKYLDRVYELLEKEGVQDLKNNLANRQLKPRVSQTQKEEQNYDILLISANRQGYPSTSPMGLYLLESYVEQFGYKARVCDITADNLLNMLETEKIPEIIGFYCAYDNQYLVANAIKFIKKNMNIITFVGGPQAVALGEAFIRETGCDIVTEGEGEEALKELLDYYIGKKGTLSDIKNIKYVNGNNQFQKNEMRAPIKDLDSLPFPKVRYDNNGETVKSYLGYMVTGRGCPFQCAFCYEGAHSKVVRYRSIKNVFEEVNYIIEKNPKTKYIQIYDDTFTLDVKRVLAFCEEMKKVREHHELYWFCEAHVNNLYKNPGLISQMVDAGLYQAQIGIESGSLKVLKAYNKNTTPEMICEVVKMCNEARLPGLEGNIIVGGAWETSETVEESIELSKKIVRAGIGMIELQSLFFAPYPYTPMTNYPEEYGIEILDDQIEKTISSMGNPVVKTQGLSRLEIIEARKRIQEAISEEYKKITLEFDKEVILNKFLDRDKRIKSINMWGAQIYRYEHMRKYVKMATHPNYKFSDTDGYERWYPIRTFELLEYVDNKLILHGLIFENVQMKVLEYSTGRYAIAEIARMAGVSNDFVFQACIELERRCFIYFSRF